MPSKIQLDENLWFLYRCLQNSDFKTVSSPTVIEIHWKVMKRKIDFNSVAKDTGLQTPAARMRFTRLRRALENGTITGTHGSPFKSSSSKKSETSKKRKQVNARGCSSSLVEDEDDKEWHEDDLESGSESSDDDLPVTKKMLRDSIKKEVEETKEAIRCSPFPSERSEIGIWGRPQMKTTNATIKVERAAPMYDGHINSMLGRLGREQKGVANSGEELNSVESEVGHS